MMPQACWCLDCAPSNVGREKAGTVGDVLEGAPGEVERVFAFVHALEDRACTRRVELPWGAALFHDELPRVWSFNFVRVTADISGVDADEILEASEDLHADAGLAHRQVIFDDGDGARRFEPAFGAAAYGVERDVVMVHRRAADRTIETSRVREVDFEGLAAFTAETHRRSPHGEDEETIRQLVERGRVLERATALRRFAVPVDGRVVSACELYSDGRTAQIEDVNTLEEERGRGHARAVVTRALEEARATGCDLVFLIADAGDWPRELYAKLGFVPLTHTADFVRPPPPSGPVSAP
jgi:GNAT superfamily N-acetyltransferase